MFTRPIKNLFTCAMMLVGLSLIFAFVGGSAISAQGDPAYVRQVRVLEDLGIAHPDGLAF